MKMAFRMAAIAAITMMVGALSSVAQSNDSAYVIVANKEMPGGAINAADLREVYQREATNWKHSKAEIVPVDLYTAKDFYQNLFGQSYLQMQVQWMKMRRDYSMNMPIFKKDAESVKKFVAANKGAIGFIKISEVDDTVKVIKLIN